MRIGHAHRLQHPRRLVAAFIMLIVPVLGLFGTSPRASSSTLKALSPISVSFLSSGEGWALSTYHCKTGNCAEVEKTLNAGRSWTSSPLPTQLQKVVSSYNSNYMPFGTLMLHFANRHDGWIYGSFYASASSTGTDVQPTTELWATHDGGDNWTAVDATAFGMKFGVLALTSNGGQVYAVAWLTDQTFGLWQSSTATSSWKRVATPSLPMAAGGTSMEAALVLKGTSGWLMVGNDRGVTGSARLNSAGRWVKWNAPCFSVGNGFVVPVAYSATSLIDVCTIGGFGSYIAPGTPNYVKLGSNWVYSSKNGGASFTPTSRVMINNSSLNLSLFYGIPASPAPGVILVTKFVSLGQTLSDHLYLSRDGGRTWTLAYATSFAPSQQMIENPSFASPELGSAIVQTTGTSSILIISTDGGGTWHKSTT